MQKEQSWVFRPAAEVQPVLAAEQPGRQLPVAVFVAAVRLEESRMAAECSPKMGAGPVAGLAAAAPGAAAAPAAGHLVKVSAEPVAEALLMPQGSVVVAPGVARKQAV